MKTFRTYPKRIVLLSGLAFLLIAAGIALAGDGPGEPRSLTAGGGSQVSNGSLQLSSALGQPVAGPVGTGNLIGADGFWVGTGVQALPTPTPTPTPSPTPSPTPTATSPPGDSSGVYLPVIIR